jgi:hypothetical protein
MCDQLRGVRAAIVTIVTAALAQSMGCAHASTGASAQERMPFTSGVIGQYQLADTELRSLQVYECDGTVLERDAGSGERRVTGGVLVTRSNHQVEQIAVESRTPGLILRVTRPGNDAFALDATRPDDYTLLVSFEQGTALWYAASSRAAQALFRLRRNADNTARFFYDVPDTGRDGSRDSTSNQGRYADFGVQKQGALCIDKSSLNALQERRRVLKGRKIGPDTGRGERRTR